jgi:UDP-N-acetylmuramoylalanine--D-glutamate ligase
MCARHGSGDRRKAAMKEKEYLGVKVLVMGLGLHGGGAGTANFFLTRGAEVTVTDLKSEEELGPSVHALEAGKNLRLVLGRHRFEDFRSADLVVKNPAVPPDSPYLRHAVEHGVRVDTDVGIFLDKVREITPNLIGVTGTKGKSTTATIIHGIFSRAFDGTVLGGNIAVPVLSLLEGIRRNAYVVLELSSFQLGGVREKRYSPRVAVFTNFLEDHLNYYRNMEGYFEDKSVLYRFQGEGDILVTNREDPSLSAIDAKRGVKRVTFGLDGDFFGEGCYVESGSVRYRGERGEDRFVLETRAVKLPGAHNLSNVLAAAATAMSEGIPAEVVSEAVGAFNGIPHRLEYLGEWRGVSFYNDTAATMPEAAVRGVECFGGPVTLIAGGADKGLALEGLVRSIRERVSNLVLLEGSGTGRLLERLAGPAAGDGVPGAESPVRNPAPPFEVFGNLPEAFAHACRVTPPGGTVLLSPGFASFGMFRNEFDRGNQFKELVKELEPSRKEG